LVFISHAPHAEAFVAISIKKYDSNNESALLLLSISIYSQNRHELIDERKDKEFLSITISK
jgi:hypothetical protein